MMPVAAVGVKRDANVSGSEGALLTAVGAIAEVRPRSVGTAWEQSSCTSAKHVDGSNSMPHEGAIATAHFLDHASRENKWEVRWTAVNNNSFLRA
eukprot:1159499-Pelagomonas_calceolata.AAC.11